MCLMARVEESGGKLLEAERRLQEERQRAVLLEQHLEKMRLEPSRTSVSQKAARNKPGRNPEGGVTSGAGRRLCPASVSVGSSTHPCCGDPISYPGTQRLRAQRGPPSRNWQWPAAWPQPPPHGGSCQSLGLVLDSYFPGQK